MLCKCLSFNVAHHVCDIIFVPTRIKDCANTKKLSLDNSSCKIHRVGANKLEETKSAYRNTPLAFSDTKKESAETQRANQNLDCPTCEQLLGAKDVLRGE